MSIFRDTAPLYWGAGLQAIPLAHKSKQPVAEGWSQWADKPINEETKNYWLAHNANGNIGLVCGSESNVMVIDIDTEDQDIFDAIMAICPFSPWHRKGRKGLMLAYKYNGVKTFRVKNASGETVVEVLSSRTQCVLPPSIHPDTNLPYVENIPLYLVRDQLGSLPTDFEETLRNALKTCGVELSHAGWSKVTDFVSSGARDTTLTEMAGLFAYAVVRGERTLKEAIGMLRSYHSEFIEHSAGDLTDVEKHVSNLIKFLERDVLEKGKVLPPDWDKGLDDNEKIALGVTLGVEHTEWTYEQIVEFLKTEFEKDLSSRARSDAVETILMKMAKSPSISRIDEDRIMKYIIDVSGMGVPISTYRARLKELRQGDIAGNDHHEIARAVLDDLQQYNLIRFNGGQFVKWSGSHWDVMDQVVILAHISSHYGHLTACKKYNDVQGIMKLVSYLCEQDIEKIKIKGVNFANGFLTQELKLMPHNPDYGMTYTLPFRYIPELAGNFPNFDQFITRSWGRDPDFKDKMRALQEALCVTLFGLGSRFQKAILLHGAPKSGKTQLLRIVECLVPKSARCSLPPDGWADKFLPAVMHGKILNVCGELSEKRKIEGQSFKDIIDGSERSAQFKNQQIFQMRPTLTHWFASNHLPKTDDTSHGFIRRWLMFAFHYPVSDKDIKLDVGDTIAAQEREAITAWATQSMTRLVEKNHFTTPPSHTLLEMEFANVNNSVRMFLTESGKAKFGVKDGFCSENRLFNSYWSWCSSSGGSKPVTLIKFRTMMRELQIEFDFQVKVAQTAMGGTEMILEGMTLI